MKNKIVSIVLAIMLVIALAGNIVLFNKLVKAQENSNDYQAAMSQLVILKTDLDNANETITTLQNEITDMENVISTNTMEDREEEITAEMLEGLSAELNEEQQEANETAQNPDNNSGNTGNNNGGGNNGNTNNNTQPQQPTIPSYFQGEGFSIGEGPTLREPEHEFGDHDPSLTGGRAQ